MKKMNGNNINYSNVTSQQLNPSTLYLKKKKRFLLSWFSQLCTLKSQSFEKVCHWSGSLPDGPAQIGSKLRVQNCSHSTLAKIEFADKNTEYVKKWL